MRETVLSVESEELLDQELLKVFQQIDRYLEIRNQIARQHPRTPLPYPATSRRLRVLLASARYWADKRGGRE